MLNQGLEPLLRYLPSTLSNVASLPRLLQLSLNHLLVFILVAIQSILHPTDRIIIFNIKVSDQFLLKPVQ